MLPTTGSKNWRVRQDVEQVKKVTHLLLPVGAATFALDFMK